MYLALQKSKLLARHGGVESAAERELQGFGSSIAREMRAERRHVIKQLHDEKYLWSQVVITREMTWNAYERDPKRWQQVAAVELYIITLPVTNWLRSESATGVKGPILANPTDLQIKDAENKALATGREIVAKLKAGAEFARLVEDYNSMDEFANRGGSRGLVSKGSMQDTKLEDFSFSLPTNTIGEPLLEHEPNFRDSTVRVIKVGQKKTARTVSFDEAEPTIFGELKLQQRQEMAQQEVLKLSQGGRKGTGSAHSHAAGGSGCIRGAVCHQVNSLQHNTRAPIDLRRRRTSRSRRYWWHWGS